MIIDSIPRNGNTPLIISVIKIINTPVLSKTRVIERSWTHNTGVEKATNDRGGGFLVNPKEDIVNDRHKLHKSR